MDERQLIDGLRRGDPRVERLFYDTHVDAVFGSLVRLVGGDEDLARLYTQEAFIRAFEKIDQFRGEAALGSWLRRIAMNTALSGLRSRGRRHERQRPLEDLDRRGRGSPSPEEGLEYDLRDRVRAAVDALPEIYRTVIVLHDLEGYTHEEIGERLEIATGSSRARLSRGRAMLREELSDIAEEIVA